MRIIKNLIVKANETELVFELPIDNEILDINFYGNQANNRSINDTKFHKWDQIYFKISFLIEENSSNLYTKEFKIFYENEKIPRNSLYI